MDSETKKQFGLVNADYYNYLNQNDCYTVRYLLPLKIHISNISSFQEQFYQFSFLLNIVSSINIQVDGVDDQQEFKECMEAMTTMGMDADDQSDVIQIVTGNVLYCS